MDSPITTLTELAATPDGALEIRCGKCGMATIIWPALLASRFPGAVSIERLKARLKCHQCGEKRAEVTAHRAWENEVPRGTLTERTRR